MARPHCNPEWIFGRGSLNTGGSSELTPAVLRSGSPLWNRAICLRRAALGQHPSACQKIDPLFKPDVGKLARRIWIFPFFLRLPFSLVSFSVRRPPVSPLYYLFLFCFLAPPSTPLVPQPRGTLRTCSERKISSLAERPSPIPCLDRGTAGSLNRCSPLFDFSAFELILSAQLLKQLSPTAASHFGQDLTHSASLWHTRIAPSVPRPIVTGTKRCTHTQRHMHTNTSQRRHLGSSA